MTCINCNFLNPSSILHGNIISCQVYMCAYTESVSVSVSIYNMCGRGGGSIAPLSDCFLSTCYTSKDNFQISFVITSQQC